MRAAMKIALMTLLVACGETSIDYKHDLLAQVFIVTALGLAAKWGVPNIFSGESMFKRVQP